MASAIRQLSADTRLRVLIIDDEPMMVAALRRSLQRRCDVATAEDVDEALTVLTSDEWFDAIVCDVNMPGLTGPEIKELLHTLGSPLAGRFVWMSGGRCPVDGPSVTKPFSQEELDETIRLVAALPRPAASLGKESTVARLVRRTRTPADEPGEEAYFVSVELAAAH